MKSASDVVVLSINLVEESRERIVPHVDLVEPDVGFAEPDVNFVVPDERPPIAAAEIPPLSPYLDEQPPQKKPRSSFTATFSKSWKDFGDLKERQKKNITKP